MAEILIHNIVCIVCTVRERSICIIRVHGILLAKYPAVECQFVIFNIAFKTNVKTQMAYYNNEKRNGQSISDSAHFADFAVQAR